MPGRPRTRDIKPSKPETPAPAAPASPEVQNGQVEPPPPHPGGRPTKLTPEVLQLAERAGKAGLIDEQVAGMLGIVVSTYYAWLKQHPEFSEALKRGQTDPAARVRMSLYQRAIGYNVPEEKIFMHEGKPVRVDTFRHIGASDTAIIFWLCNKLPEEFKHVQHIQAGGGVDLNLKNTVPAGFLADMNRTLAAMGEAPGAAGRIPATPPARPARAPGKPGKAAAPARSQAPTQDEDEIPLTPPGDLEDDNPPTALDLSGLEDGDE